jgi:hypothetical protein
LQFTESAENQIDVRITTVNGNREGRSAAIKGGTLQGVTRN